VALTAGADPGSSSGPARRHDVPFVLDTRWTFGYRLARRTVELLVHVWFRPRIVGRENIPGTGPVVLAPVHRSFADFVFTAVLTDRKLFFMAKDSLWESRLLARILPALGVFPVHREAADRDAMARAEEVLRQGQVLVMFPEGTRQHGPEVQALLDGVAFLAARTGAAMVPIGIGGSDRSMPKGSKIPKPIAIALVVGEPVPPPERGEGGRAPRSKVRATTGALREGIQVAFDRARGPADDAATSPRRRRGRR
jgi:1-acyl-sn-glycerol-3-phosphate acyltransferase